MKTTIIVLTAILVLAQGLCAASRGEHRTSGDRKTELVYLDASHALIKYKGTLLEYKNPSTKEGIAFGDLYTLCEAKYAGPPEVVEFTGDIPGKDLVQGVMSLHLFEHAVIGIGFDPKDKRPPQQRLYFISNLKTGRTSFFRSKKSYRLALSNRIGIKKYPGLLPAEYVMRNLEREFDSKRGPESLRK